MSTERKSGYYWIIWDNNQWEIGLWDEIEEQWVITSLLSPIPSDQLDKINETTLLPPTE